MLGFIKKTLGGSADTDTEPTKGPASHEESLKPLFAHAAHGQYFHSHPYVQKSKTRAETVWLEAHFVPHLGWRILKAVYYEPARTAAKPTTQEDLIQKSEEKTFPRFIEAAQHLINYEAAQETAGLAPCDPPQAADFKPHTFVRAFAETEGLALDDQDIVHPTTEEGEIITSNAIFPASAVKKAREAAARKKQHIALEFSSIPDLALPQPLLAAGVKNSMTLFPELNEMEFILRELRNLVYAGERYRWCAIATEPLHFCDEDSHYDESLYKGKIYTSARRSYEAYLEAFFSRALFKHQNALKDEMRKAFDIAEMSVHLSYALDSSKHGPKTETFHAGKGQKMRFEYSPAHTIIARKQIALCLKNIGIGSGDAESALIGRMVDHRQTTDIAHTAKIDEIVTWFNKTNIDINKKAGRYATKDKTAIPVDKDLKHTRISPAPRTPSPT